MRAAFLAWKHGHMDPFRFYNMLDADFRPLEPLEDGSLGEPVRPRNARRLRNVVAAFAEAAEAEQQALAGARMAGGFA